MKRLAFFLVIILVASWIMATSVFATSFFFSTGNPDGLIGTASRPAGNGKTEIESADDFILHLPTTIDQATFTGLVPSGSTIQQVIVEIYRVFPSDSNVGATSGPPTFSTSKVPTRVNSPSDVAFDDRDSAVLGYLSFTTTLLSPTFTANNSVLNGINPQPNQTTGGEGAIAGQEFLFDVTFTTPFDLPAGHYFFIPQVLLSSGDFFWLSAPKPILPPGTAFGPDLQSWIRNENLDPDWLRIGTDIVGGVPKQTYNAAFSLNGTAIREPSTLLLIGAGLVGVGLMRRKLRK